MKHKSERRKSKKVKKVKPVKGDGRMARGNYFTMRSNRSTRSTRSIRTGKKQRQRLRQKIERERVRLKEIEQMRDEYIKTVKQLTKEYKTADPKTVDVLFKKVGSEDLIRKILGEIEKVNSELDARLQTLLAALQDIDAEDAGLYEIDDLISRADAVLATTNMDRKTHIIDEILSKIQEILEQEEQLMETGHHNVYIVAIIDRLL